MSEINNMPATLVWGFFAHKIILGRTETRTRDRMYLGRIRSVRDISRGDSARIATSRLRTPTDLRQIIILIVRGRCISSQNHEKRVVHV